MKFVTFYVLTCLIVWEMAGGGEFSQQDLHYIAERLNPLECSKLLKELPAIGKSEKKHKEKLNELSEYWESEKSEECFESLYECNERGKKEGCTKKWLIGALYKFGRADLAARLKKKWKKPEKKKKPKKKYKAKETRSSPTRTNERSKNDATDRPEKSVKSEAHSTSKTIESEPKLEKIILDHYFVIFVAAASFLILAFLATILFVAYRRACSCCRNFEDHHFRKEKKSSWHAPQKKDSGVCTTEIPDEILDPGKLSKWTRFALESESPEIEDEELSKNYCGPSKSKDKKVEKVVKMAKEPEVPRYNPEETKSKRKMSPCARIKRFIASQRRRVLRREKERESKKRRRKKKNGERAGVKNVDVVKISPRAEKASSRNVQKNLKKKSSPRSVKKKEKKIGTHEKTLYPSKLIACTCDVCTLFNLKDEQKFLDRTKNPRDRKS